MATAPPMSKLSLIANDRVRFCFAGAMAAPAGFEAATPLAGSAGAAAVPIVCGLSFAAGSKPGRRFPVAAEAASCPATGARAVRQRRNLRIRIRGWRCRHRLLCRRLLRRSNGCHAQRRGQQDCQSHGNLPIEPSSEQSSCLSSVPDHAAAKQLLPMLPASLPLWRE